MINFHGTLDLVVPYAATRERWVDYSTDSAILGCTGETRVIYRDEEKEEEVECVEYSSCESSAPPGTSVWCTYTGMGHSWAGSSEWPSNLPATPTMWGYWTGAWPSAAPAGESGSGNSSMASV